MIDKMFLKIVLSPFIWLFYMASAVPAYLAGFIVVPICAALKLYEITDLNESKPADGPIIHWTPKFMWAWDNASDGICNENYYKGPNRFFTICYWTLIRNPINNFKIYFIGFKWEAIKIKFVGSYENPLDYETDAPQWYFCTHDYRTSFYLKFHFVGYVWWLWCGFKLRPRMIMNLAPEYQKTNVGLTGIRLRLKKITD